MMRRDFLGSAGAAAGLRVAESEAPAALPKMGDPYDLAGKRLYFLNWYYIRPGSFGWFGPDNDRLSMKAEVEADFGELRRADSPHGIRLVAQPAERLGPLFEPEKPWEEGSVALTTVLQDGGRFRAWGAPFTTSGDPPGQKHFVAFESDDGLTWRRPTVGLVEANGSRANNIVNIFGTDGGTVFVDPSAPAAERYKLIAEKDFPPEAIADYLRRRPGAREAILRMGRDGAARGLCGGVSADGLNWTEFREPLAMEVTDTNITASWDAQLRKYVAFTRTWVAGEQSRKVQGNYDDRWSAVGRRAIGRSETADFRNFPLHETILEPGPDLLPSDTLYTNGKTTMPGAPDHHVLFPTIWSMADDSTRVALATSHNGKLWHFLAGSPVLSTGVFGTFDGGCVFAHPNLLELADGRFVLPYSGYNVPHKYPRRRWRYRPAYAVWPKGRLVALEAADTGEFATVGLMAPGRKLKLNAVVKRGGSLRVEVAGLTGKTLAGRSFADSMRVVGDWHYRTMAWRGEEDLGNPEGTAVMLRFRMDRAALYGLEFA